jgi:hypothetical protein
LSGIELMHMISKDQMEDRGIGYTRAERFYSRQHKRSYLYYGGFKPRCNKVVNV